MITCPFDRYVLFNIFLCNCFYLEPPGVISRVINTDRLATRIWSLRLALVQHSSRRANAEVAVYCCEFAERRRRLEETTSSSQSFKEQWI